MTEFFKKKFVSKFKLNFDGNQKITNGNLNVGKKLESKIEKSEVKMEKRDNLNIINNQSEILKYSGFKEVNLSKNEEKSNLIQLSGFSKVNFSRNLEKSFISNDNKIENYNSFLKETKFLQKTPILQ